LTCYECDREPTQQCPRCGRPYCEEHGEEFCGICLHPASGVPSFTLYRGSLLALLIGTALAVWLLIQPTTGESQAGLPLVLTPTTVTGAGRQATPETPPAGETPVAGVTGTPAATATPGTPAATTPAAGTPAPTASYTVVSGDTLSGICEARKPARLGLQECIDEVKQLNNLTSDTLEIGQQLRLPQ
jgi:LysM repeat protein